MHYLFKAYAEQVGKLADKYKISIGVRSIERQEKRKNIITFSEILEIILAPKILKRNRHFRAKPLLATSIDSSAGRLLNFNLLHGLIVIDRLNIHPRQR